MNRPPALLLALPVVIILGGIGLSLGAVLSYKDQHSGRPGTAKVSSCTGRTGRYSTGVHCTGSWIIGGALTDGGHVVLGDVTNATRGDIGKTIAVRFHGADHATKPNTRISVILALLGVPMVLFGVYLLFTILSRSSTASTKGSAAS